MLLLPKQGGTFSHLAEKHLRLVSLSKYAAWLKGHFTCNPPVIVLCIRTQYTEKREHFAES